MPPIGTGPNEHCYCTLALRLLLRCHCRQFRPERHDRRHQYQPQLAYDYFYYINFIIFMFCVYNLRMC